MRYYLIYSGEGGIILLQFSQPYWIQPLNSEYPHFLSFTADSQQSHQSGSLRAFGQPSPLTCEVFPYVAERR
jgi:hypothetical protein